MNYPKECREIANSYMKAFHKYKAGGKGLFLIPRSCVLIILNSIILQDGVNITSTHSMYSRDFRLLCHTLNSRLPHARAIWLTVNYEGPGGAGPDN